MNLPAIYFKRSITALTWTVGLLWLAKDLEDYDQAAQTWRGYLVMIDQNTLLWVFVAFLIGMIIWSDGRRYVQDRKGKRAAATLQALIGSRTRFTLREAACIAVGVHPSKYDESLAAQGEASEMLYYAREGLIRPAAMSNMQWEAMKRGQEIEGYSRNSITLDSFISKGEMETYMRPGWKVWLPVLDHQRRERD